MGKYIKWLEKELGEKISTKRAAYMTIWALSFFTALIGGCAENIAICAISLVVLFYSGCKAGVMIWQKK